VLESSIPRLGTQLSIVAGLTIGCHEPTLRLVAPSDPGTQSIILAEEFQGRLTLEARSADDPPLTKSIRGSGDIDLTVLLYRTPLSELGLASGTILPADPGKAWIPIPQPDAEYRATVRGDAASGWTRSSTLSSAIKAFHAATKDATECIEAGGCFLSLDEAQLTCVVPCPMPAAIDAPMPPTPAHLTPCPAGWREETTADADMLDHCEPWPSGGRPSCDRVSAIFPGDPACAPIGGPCPSGDYASGLPAGTRYVKAGSPPGGAGTQGAPFASIGEAMSTAAPGSTIAVARGQYREGVALGPGVTLVGVCASTTTISVSGSSVAVALASGTATVRGVSLVGGQNGAVASGHAKLILDQAIVSDAALGISAVSATVSAHQILIRRSAIAGATASLGGVVVIRSGVIESSSGTSLLISGAGSSGVLRGVSMHDNIGTAGAVSVSSGASADVAETVMEHVGMGLNASGDGATLSATDVLIRDLNGDTPLGAGFDTRGRAIATRVLIERARFAGLQLSTGASCDFSDLAVRQTLPEQASMGGGNGFSISGGSRLNGSRALLSDNRDTSFQIADSLSEATIADLVIRETLSKASTRSRGSGIVASNGAVVNLARAQVSKSRNIGVQATDADTVLNAEDLVVSDTLPNEIDGGYGRGIEVDHAQVNVMRARLLRNRNLEIYAYDSGAHVILSDIQLSDTTQSDHCVEFECAAGVADGLTSDLGAVVEMSRFVSLNNQQYGMRVTADSKLILKDGLITMNAVGLLIVGTRTDLAQLDERVAYTGNSMQNITFLGQ
jgi:hypothetical protein